MSKFLIEKLKNVAPYVPGEQPKDRRYIKLNTNESPYPPSPLALRMMMEEADGGNLYPDPEYTALVSVAAEKLGVKKENLFFTNGSDETLNFAFAAYCAEKTAVFADVTYGFYEVFADYYKTKKKIIPLKEDFSIDVTEYYNAEGTVFIANPNAPTGLLFSLAGPNGFDHCLLRGRMGYSDLLYVLLAQFALGFQDCVGKFRLFRTDGVDSLCVFLCTLYCCRTNFVLIGNLFGGFAVLFHTSTLVV